MLTLFCVTCRTKALWSTIECYHGKLIDSFDPVEYGIDGAVHDQGVEAQDHLDGVIDYFSTFRRRKRPFTKELL